MKSSCNKTKDTNKTVNINKLILVLEKELFKYVSSFSWRLHNGGQL